VGPRDPNKCYSAGDPQYWFIAMYIMDSAVHVFSGGKYSILREIKAHFSTFILHSFTI